MPTILKSCARHGLCLSLFALSLFTMATSAEAEMRYVFERISTQYIAALGNPDARSGTGAERWGIWRKDPGPRGVWLRRFDRLKTSGGVAPAKWTFDQKDWWLDENGLIMEKPDFTLPAGQYLVTGDRETLSVLTVHPKDAKGAMSWDLDFGAKLYDVTHLPCRSARYMPVSAESVCSPERALKNAFPVQPGHSMPTVPGCLKQDYAVLFVVGKAVETKVSSADLATCKRSGKRYPGARVLEGKDGALVMCEDPRTAQAHNGQPYNVRRAELRSFEDPSQQPRCNAKEQIEAQCGASEVCVFKVNNNLCTEPEVAKYTTHVQVEWKCHADQNWRFDRVERGKELVFDCRR